MRSLCEDSIDAGQLFVQDTHKDYLKAGADICCPEPRTSSGCAGHQSLKDPSA